MLKDLNLIYEYDTSNNNIVEEFYKPCLSNSLIYNRGVGYFTSGWISENSKGLSKFIGNGGKAKYITSPILDKNDLNPLQGIFDKSKIENIILKNIDNLEKNLEKETRNLLGWLVYDGILEFRFAIPKIELNGGDFHDKFGIFIDNENNIVSFNGSINESIKGFYNYESISVFKSWQDDTGNNQCLSKLNRFNKLWDNNDPNIYIYKINDIIKANLVKLKDNNSKRPYNNNKILLEKLPKLPKWLELRDYQKSAINSWIKNNGRGILSMATGTGKTLTALSAITHLINNIHTNIKITLIVIVPYSHLLEQWDKEAKEFNYNFVKCNSNYPKWESYLHSTITKNMYSKNILSIITTQNSFKLQKFQSIISSFKNILLVVDEVHNFGSKDIKRCYIENATYRLGLSATPKRHLDDEGSQNILNYFNGIVFSYGLKEAIHNNNLTPYYYYPIFVQLTESENQKYLELSDKISKMMKYNDIELETSDGLKLLLIKRAKIIESAENKIKALKDLLLTNNLVDTKNNLFYVSSLIKKDNKFEIKMIDRIIILLKELGMEVNKFTSTENKDKRNYLIEQLENRLINGLVAIRCLDEGVDIPSVERAFILSSSSNPKEFIQRRGRILRKSKNKKYASIYDFLVLPNINESNIYTYNYERKYIEKELKRFQEFVELAENSHEIEPKVLNIKKEYNLLHI